MLLYILKKSGQKHILIASPDRILRLIFNGVNVVFIEKNWHNHNFCSLVYRISSNMRSGLLLMECRYCQGLIKSDNVFETCNVSVGEGKYVLFYKSVRL